MWLVLILLFGPFIEVDLYNTTWTSSHMNAVNNRSQPQPLKYNGKRIYYYSNSTATFNVSLLVAGDIEANPGPENKDRTKRENNDRLETFCRIRYSRAALLDLDHNGYVSSDVWTRLESLGINVKNPTMRETGGGVKRKRKDYSLPSDSCILTTCKKPFFSDDRKKNCTLCLINTQSASNKADLLTDYIIEHDLDIVCLTETWLSNAEKHRKIIADLTLPGYKFQHAPRLNRTGGGVAVIHRESVNLVTSSIHTFSSFESMCCDLIPDNTGSVSLKLIILYKPPYSRRNKITSSMFLQDFADYLSVLAVSPSKLVIVGDFNIHWDDKANADTKKFADIMTSHNLLQHVHESTHTDGHILDYVLSRSDEDVIKSVEVSTFLSDHAAVHCDLNIYKPAAGVEK